MTHGDIINLLNNKNSKKVFNQNLNNNSLKKQ